MSKRAVHLDLRLQQRYGQLLATAAMARNNYSPLHERESGSMGVADDSERGRVGHLRTPFLLLAVSFVLAAAPSAYGILNGAPDENGHPYVGMVFNDFALCSGFLVSPTVFVTAGHCTAVFERPGGGAVQISFAADASDFVGQVTGTPHTHPNFCLGCQGNQGSPGADTHDIGVVTLDAPVQLAEYPRLPTAGAVEAVGPRDLLTSVGYGIRARPRNFQGEIAVRYFSLSRLIPSNDVMHDEFVKVSGNPGQGKGGVCLGDSGGPLLDESQTALGIAALTQKINCTFELAYRLDTPDALNFIRAFL